MIVKSGYKSVNGDYVFSKTQQKVESFKKNNPKIKVIDLGVGDVKLPLAKPVAKSMQKAARALKHEKTFRGYPPDFGYIFLRNKISDYYKSLGAYVSPDEVFITGGAKPSLADIVSLADFERAFIHRPNYPLYTELCSAYGIEYVTADCPPEKYAGVAKENDCDLCFVCSPCNPTGEVIGRSALEKLCGYVKERGGAVVIDAAYAFFNENYCPPFMTKSEEKTVIEVRTFSKSLSFTGVRCGFTVIKKQNPLYEPYKKLLSLKYNGVNVTAQCAAAVAFLSGMREEHAKRRNYYRKNAELLASPFVKRGYSFSGGAYVPYLLVRVNESGESFAEKLLEKAAVCVTPGEGFGATNSIRISCLCTREAAVLGSERLDKFLSGQKPV